MRFRLIHVASRRGLSIFEDEVQTWRVTRPEGEDWMEAVAQAIHQFNARYDVFTKDLTVNGGQALRAFLVFRSGTPDEDRTPERSLGVLVVQTD